MIMENLPALQVVIPLLSAAICAVLPSGKVAWGWTAVTCAIAFAVSLALFGQVYHGTPISYAMGGWTPPYGIEYRVDLLNAFILVVISAIAFFSSFYALKSVQHEIEDSKIPLFYASFLLCFAGLLGITITNDAFNIYVFLEISSLATYALIAMGSDKRALIASFEYLILGTIGATFILIAIGLLYMMTGTLNISDLAIRVPSLIHTTPVKASLAFFTVGLLLKIAVFPLHLWLTNAYTNAPSVVSSFLSATATKVSIYVLIKILFIVFGAKLSLIYMSLDKILMVLALFAIVIGSLVAIYQNNIKRMLAYSSVAQIGYIILGISLVSVSGISASMIHIFNHAIAKAVLFMAVGCIFLRVGGVRIPDLNGIASKMPYTCAAFVAAGLSLIGVPATGGFISKWYLLSALSEQGLWPVFAVVIVSSILALIYIWRMVEIMYFKEYIESDNKITEAPFMMLLPMWLLAALVFVFGIYTSPVTASAQKVAKYLFGI